LREYNKKFSTTETSAVLGSGERVDLPINSKIIVNGDIHGALTDLEERKKKWQEMGYLDENNYVSQQWKGKILFIFLGDYIDRGPKSWECVEALIDLKMKNPDEFLLIRGNHEDRRISVQYMYPQSAKDLYKNPDFWDEIEKFFNSLPICVIAGSGKEYAIFTHGTVLLDEDLFDLLENPNQRYKRNIEVKTVKLSQRIFDLIPPGLRNRKLKDINEEEILASRKEALKPLSWIRAALRVQDFILPNMNFMTNDRRERMSTLTWGDANSQDVSGPNLFRGKGVKLSTSLVEDYFNVVSSESRQLKLLFKGHGHLEKIYRANGKTVVYMLPVAGTLEGYDSVRKTTQDISYVLTTGDRMENWVLERMTRERQATFSSLNAPMHLYPELCGFEEAPVQQPKLKSSSASLEPIYIDLDDFDSSSDEKDPCSQDFSKNQEGTPTSLETAHPNAISMPIIRSQRRDSKRQVSQVQIKESQADSANQEDKTLFSQKFKLKRR
ncbi:MAG: metallophosphoesterase family protein, partial [Parachlamydiales bacterium]